MNNEPTTPAGGGVGEPYSSDLWEGFNLDAPPPETPIGGVLHADFTGHSQSQSDEKARPRRRTSREGNAVPKEAPKNDGKRSNYPVHTQFEIVMDWLKDCRLVCADNSAFIVVPVDGKPQPIEIESRDFEDYVSILAEDQHIILKPQAKTMLMDSLGALARKRGDIADIFLRVGGTETEDGDQTHETVYIDLGDRTHRVVEITRHGWNVLEGEAATAIPIMFRRTPTTLPLPLPVRVHKNEREQVWKEFEDLMRPGCIESWVKMIAFELNCFRPPTGDYVGLCITGPEGSGKTTRSLILRNVIDPNENDLAGEITEKRDFPAIVRSGFVLALTNLSSLPAWVSDLLCRVATDGKFSMRELQTTAELRLVKAKRPILLNGISPDIIKFSDLKRRLMFVELPPPEGQKVNPKTLNRRFKKLHPRLLGVFFDAVCAWLRHANDADIEALDWGHGMVDFGAMIAAAEKGGALPWKTLGTFHEVYTEGLKETAHGVLAGNAIAQAIIGLIEDLELRGEKGEWRGPATLLRSRIEMIAAWQSLDREEVLLSEIRAEGRNKEYFFTDLQRVELRSASIMQIRALLPENIRAKWDALGRKNVADVTWLKATSIGKALSRIEPALEHGAGIKFDQPYKTKSCNNTDYVIWRMEDDPFEDE